MSRLVGGEFLSVEDYLAGEEGSDIRHEYINGEIHAMSGASIRHNTIAGNLFSAIHSHLSDGPCQVFISETKVRLRIADEDIFYYPDLLIACDPSDTATYFREHPVIVVEVLSPSTERIDRREKLLAYKTIPSLEMYVMIDQEAASITLLRRSNNWIPEHLTGPDQSLDLEPIKLTVKLGSIYARTGLV